MFFVCFLHVAGLCASVDMDKGRFSKEGSDSHASRKAEQVLKTASSKTEAEWDEVMNDCLLSFSFLCALSTSPSSFSFVDPFFSSSLRFLAWLRPQPFPLDVYFLISALTHPMSLLLRSEAPPQHDQEVH